MCQHFAASVLFLTLALARVHAATGDSPQQFLVEVWDTERGLPHSSVTSITQTRDGYLWVGTLHGGLARFDGARFLTFHPGNAPEIRSIEIERLFSDPSGTLWIGTVDGSLTTLRDGVFREQRRGQSPPGDWLWRLISARDEEVWLQLQSGSLLRADSARPDLPPQLLKVPESGGGSSYCFDKNNRMWHRTGDGRLFRKEGNGFEPASLAGLQGRTVNALRVDNSGTLWLGTDREIARWDGQCFQTMTPTNGPPDIHVADMVFTGDDGLWVRFGAALWKCAGRQWVATAAPWTGQFRPGTRPIGMEGDPAGGLWFFHYEAGGWYIDASGRALRLAELEGMPGALIESWFQDREANMWLGTSGGGLVRLRKRDFHTLWPSEWAMERTARSVAEDNRGRIWAAASHPAFFCYKDGSFETFRFPPEESLGHDLTICPDQRGRVWVGSVQGGVWLLENGELRRPFPASAVGTVARVLFNDRAGRMWIGNEFGLQVWENETLRRFTIADGFGPGYVLSITEDRDGGIWIGTADSEIRRYHHGKFVSFKPDDGFGPLRVLALLADQDGSVWAGTLGGGLLRLKEGHFTRFLSKDGLPDENISQLLEDGRGQLWAGSRTGVFRVAKASLEAFAAGENKFLDCHAYGKYDGLPAVECSSGYQPSAWRTAAGTLWFATVKGLVSVQPEAISRNYVSPPVIIQEVLLNGKPYYEITGQSQKETVGNKLARRPTGALGVPPGQHYFEFRFAGLSFVAPDKVRFQWRLAGLDADWIEGGNKRFATYSFVPPGTYSFQVRAANNDGLWNETGDSLELVILPHFWQTWWFKLGVVMAVVSFAGLAYSQRVARLRALAGLRLRIARDLHDEVGANLGSISLLSQVMERLPNPADASQIRQIAAESIDTLRDIVWFIDPTHERLSDLVMRMEETARRMLKGINYGFEQQGQFSSSGLPLEFRRNILPIFKETLHNILKHAGATRVDISVQRGTHRFRMVIRDNGTGFNTNSLFSGNGLKNMRRRAADLRGQLQVTSEPGGGTTIELTAPIP